jgi:anti-anti-sigma factor
MDAFDNFIEERYNDVLVIKTGFTSVTLENATIFKEFLLQKIESGELKIIVDLAEIGYLDSSFMGSLVLALKRVTAKGGTLKLILSKEDSPLKTMFENTQMSKVFDTFKDLESALNSIS